MGDEFSLICKMVTGFVIICGLIFAVGVMVASARWVDVLHMFANQNLWVDSLVDFCGCSHISKFVG